MATITAWPVRICVSSAPIHSTRMRSSRRRAIRRTAGSSCVRSLGASATRLGASTEARPSEFPTASSSKRCGNECSGHRTAIQAEAAQRQRTRYPQTSSRDAGCYPSCTDRHSTAKDDSRRWSVTAFGTKRPSTRVATGRQAAGSEQAAARARPAGGARAPASAGAAAGCTRQRAIQRTRGRDLFLISQPHHSPAELGRDAPQPRPIIRSP